MPFSTDDTIVAVATAAGHGGIGIVRLAGPEATAIACRLTRRASFEPRHATTTTIHDPSGPTQPLDSVVVTWFQAPRSYTGDDVVEIGAHGSPAVLHAIVEAACAAGARLAEPGEFTLRAYLNGRLDLVQAEAVADLVAAVTPAQARIAVDQLEGTLSAALREIDHSLLDLSARLEASLDFPDEGFHFVTTDETTNTITSVLASLDDLAREGQRGRLIREGRTVVIAGRPNVGKSSLFNRLVGAGRAIVTEVAGTTRDMLTERVDVVGVPVTLVDTAGLHETTDAIEAEGVRRARAALAAAAVTVLVTDGSIRLQDADRDVLGLVPRPVLLVVNKIDRPQVWSPHEWLDGEVDVEVCAVSALTGEGLDALRDAMVRMLSAGDDLRDTPRVSNLRHVQCVLEARRSLAEAQAALAAGATEELVLAGVTEARQILEQLTGARTADDLLAHVFSRFCVGK